MITSRSSSKAASTSLKNEHGKTVADTDGEAMNVVRLLIEDPDSPEVRALLEASEIAPFADYQPDPLSMFMEKR